MEMYQQLARVAYFVAREFSCVKKGGCKDACHWVLFIVRCNCTSVASDRAFQPSRMRNGC